MRRGVRYEQVFGPLKAKPAHSLPNNLRTKFKISKTEMSAGTKKIFAKERGSYVNVKN